MRTADSHRLAALFKQVREAAPKPAQVRYVQIPGTVAVPQALLEQLAPREVPHDVYRDNCSMCGFPDGPAATRDRSTHAPDCPWVAGRALLGDFLEG